jgi:hypothetical protein
MAFPLLKLWKRFSDRGCCKPLKKDGTVDEVNTAKYL